MPISKAVVGLDRAADGLPARSRSGAASSIDGGIRSTTNVDIAVEQGAKFIVVVNPLVPYVNDFQKRIPTIFGSRVRRVSDMGYPQVGYQAFKLLAHARLHEHVKHWRERYPGVDIILIEPDPNDELMFGTSIMNYSSRIEIARHGFESVTLRLAQDYRHYKQICEKHGIEISARRVTKILRQADEQREKTTAWRRIFEQTTGALLRQSRALEPSGVDRQPNSERRLQSRLYLSYMRVEAPRVLVVHDVALDLQRRRQLAGLLGQVVGQDRELLDLLDAGRPSRSPRRPPPGRSP